MIKLRRLVVRVVVAAAVFLPCFVESAPAAEATASVELLSAYVYHGVTYNDGIVAQPNLDVSSGNVGFNIFANYDIDDYDGALQGGEFSEVDLSVYCFGTIAGMDCSLTYSEYLYPHVGDGDGSPLPGNREVIATLQKGLSESLSVKLDVRYELDEIKDYYTALKLIYGASLTDAISLSMSGLVAYVGKHTSMGGNEGFNEYTLSLGTTYSVSEALDVSATIYHSASLDEDVLPDQDVETFGSIGVSWSL